MILLFLIALGIFASIIALIMEFKNYKDYMHSDYYHMTHISYYGMISDIGKKGEYHTYLCLKSLKGYKKYLFNCYIPKEDGTTTEIDAILIHETGIYVF